ncbi:MAG: DNA repair protein RadA [Bacteroidia bacterium]|nr:DNA repair protein RadA [Bacteroidia bacterium]MDW8159114.1 DNA repair protein RadA [Bacteroidia bacterium]
MAKSSKSKNIYRCTLCHYSTPKWLGQCPSCGAWNSIEEERVEEPTVKHSFYTLSSSSKSKLIPIQEIATTAEERIVTPDKEWNRVLDGGLVRGSFILLAGEPGIGKSTLLLQLALQLNPLKIIYVSGEESERQIKLRAERIPFHNSQLYVLAGCSLEDVLYHGYNLLPDIIVIDSIQTIYSEKVEALSGSTTQIRECTHFLMQFAKENNCIVILIGHITKEGTIAGPKLLEHMVDVVLEFEGDPKLDYRLLRAVKNRFGSTAEMGIYQMHNKGLVEIPNPGELFLSNHKDSFSGVATGALLIGQRTFLIENQALVASTVFNFPQRSTTGYDAKRLNMLLAVLEKRIGITFINKDVFVNVVGGLKLEDPAADLPVLVAIISSYYDIPIPREYCFAGEISLTGEIRTVSKLEARMKEAAKIGFRYFITAEVQSEELKQNLKQKVIPIELVPITGIQALLGYLNRFITS